MENFVFQNPTRILFGRGQIAALDNELPAEARVLLLAGGGSIKTNGVHQQICAALGSRFVVECFGVEANPDYETLMKAVEVARQQKVDWILAAGGGSVLDGAKFVAAAVFLPGREWAVVERAVSIERALPIATVLTLPATGSEANCAAVISWRARGLKLAFIDPAVFPRVSVLDPETTFSLPERQIANGVADAFTHVIEQYLTYPADAPLQDRFAEGILLTLLEEGPKTLANPRDYTARAIFMWAATWALNTAIAAGAPGDWSTHMIGHELTALHGIDHARTLAIVLPSLLHERREAKREKLLQYGERVWGIRAGSEEARIDAAIERTRGFYESLGIKTRLADYGVEAEVAREVTERFRSRGTTCLGERDGVTLDAVERILLASA
jgi:NADP-dependent alcohol dehydrogenase